MKILFVCLGNICRLPLAEGIMRQLVDDQNLGWEIASAGTGDWHVGCAPDKRGIAIAKEYGYDISAQQGRHFNSSFFNDFDHLLVMDKNNYSNVIAMAKNEQQRSKVQFFLSARGEVIDPYYQDDLFEPVFKVIENRCKQLIEQFKGDVS